MTAFLDMTYDAYFIQCAQQTSTSLLTLDNGLKSPLDVKGVDLGLSSAEIVDVLYRAHAGEDLTPVELFQFKMRTNALFRYWENVHYQYRVGLYDDVEFARQRKAWQASMSNSRLGQEYWCRVRLYYSPEFMVELDSLMPGKCCIFLC